jgi:hypothetical protein
MNVELEMAARGYLSRDEKLLWSGQPRGGIQFRGSDIFAIPFSLMWGGFAFFWEFSVTRIGTGAPTIFTLWGIPFVLMGLYLIIGRFFVDAWMRSKTQYFLTDQRVLIVSGILSSSAKSLPLRSLPDFTLSERSDGSGTITLGSSNLPFGGMAIQGWPGSSRQRPPALELIENVRSVNEILRDAAAKASGQGR